jgi:hypothetical protein
VFIIIFLSGSLDMADFPLGVNIRNIIHGGMTHPPPLDSHKNPIHGEQTFTHLFQQYTVSSATTAPQLKIRGRADTGTNVRDDRLASRSVDAESVQL